METRLGYVINQLKEELGTNFVVGVESASRYLGISPTIGVPLTILSTTPLDITTPNVEVVLTDSLPEESITVRDGVWVTNIEYTICDMIRLDRDPQTITEAMCYYYYSVDEEESWGNLALLASELGISEEFESYQEDAIDHALN